MQLRGKIRLQEHGRRGQENLNFEKQERKTSKNKEAEGPVFY